MKQAHEARRWLPKGIKGQVAVITKRVETVLVQRYGHKELNKRQVMAELLRRFDSWKRVADLPEGTAIKAEKLFTAMNNAFGP
jgi:hypothetical protein